MASWFLLTVSAIIMIGAVMFVGASLVSTLTEAPAHAETIQRLNTLSDLIVANSWQGGDGQIYLPAPSPGPPGPIEGIGTVPTWLKARATFPLGQLPIYCPFGHTTGSASGDVWNPDGTRYQIDTTSVRGRSYVTAGRPAYADASTNPNLAGFIMIPETPGGTYAGCNQITGSAGSYSAPGMLVRAILADRAGAVRSAGKALPRIFYANADGSGSGSHASDPISLASALALWRANPWANTRIELAAGTYALTSAALSSSAVDYVEHPARTQLTIVGPGRATTSITLASSGQIDLPVNLELSGVSIGSDNLTVIAPRMTLQARGATMGPIEVAETGIAVLNASNITGNIAARPVINLLRGSHLVVTGASTGTVTAGTRFADVQGQADLTFNSATFSLVGSSSPSILVATGGLVTIANSILSMPASPTTIFQVWGSTNVASSTIQYSAALTTTTFDLRSGARLSMNNSNITAPSNAAATRSIVSTSAGSVTGSNSTIMGCWADLSGAPVFNYSAALTTNSSSAVTADELVPTLSDTATTAQITDYWNAMARNTGRTAARLRNNSSWTCTPS